MPQPTQRRVGDFTGKKFEQQNKERDAASKKRGKELSSATLVADDDQPSADDQLAVNEEESAPIGEKRWKVRFREDVEQVTWGHGTNFEFRAGQSYRVPDDLPAPLARHLKNLGYCWPD
jgi:hypothetical protein